MPLQVSLVDPFLPVRQMFGGLPFPACRAGKGNRIGSDDL
jgi:hypothetical protein